MNIKKTIFFIFFLFLPYSCVTLKKSNKYPINSAWKYYYNNKHDTIIVYIDRISIIEGVIIRDTKVRNDTTVFGRTKKNFLYPIK